MIDITTLSQEEQLQLLEKLWDSLSSTPEAIPLRSYWAVCIPGVREAGSRSAGRGRRY